ncbi:hypothetical protein EG329_010882 [Mollisiaceae sp. DMI_Dod_QoI]|nr:hypothetical protein EG329_010882 [Helotiales sp. DMI_Dod_QoI]
MLLFAIFLLLSIAFGAPASLEPNGLSLPIFDRAVATTPPTYSQFGPPTPEMNTCLATPACKTSNYIWDWCTDCMPGAKTDNYLPNPNKNNTPTWDCLCNSNYHTTWLANFQPCIACLSSYPPYLLPPSLSQSISLWSQLQIQIDSYCGTTNPGETIDSLNWFIPNGEKITYGFKSPILFFNVSVLTGRFWVWSRVWISGNFGVFFSLGKNLHKLAGKAVLGIESLDIDWMELWITCYACFGFRLDERLGLWKTWCWWVLSTATEK